MTMIVGEGDPLVDIRHFLGRVNEVNNTAFAWRWLETDIEVYDRNTTIPFVVAAPDRLINVMQWQLLNHCYINPDE